MVDVDNLTDAELRTKLLEFGFPLMPITGTTRKVMAKKLKLLLENQQKSSASDRRSLGKFSSDEESDADTKLSKKDKNRRVTMAVPPMQQPLIKPPRRSPAPAEIRVMEPPAPVLKEKRKSTGRTAQIIVQLKDSPDTNSDSEPEIVETDYKKNYKIELPVKKPTPKQVELDSPKFPPPKPPTERESTSSRVVTSSGASSRYSVYSSPTYNPSDELEKIRSRLSLNTRERDFIARPPAPLSNNVEAEDNAPFLSSFTRKLSQLSQKQEVGSTSARSDAKEHDTNGSSLYNRNSYLTNTIKPRDYTRSPYGNLQQEVQTSAGKSTNISFILIAGAALFFVILAAVYYGMHSGGNSSEIIGLFVPYCKTTDSKNCMTKADANGAMEIYKIIKPVLITTSIRAQCEGFDKFYMTDEDIVSHIKQHYKMLNESEILHDIVNLIVLLFKNTYLGISILQVPDTENEFTSSAIINDLEDYNTNAENNYKRALAVMSPSLPWKCSLLIKCTGIINGLVIVLAISSTIWLSKYGYKWYKYYEQRRKEEIVLMVEKILDVVQTNAGEDTFMVINHVRDMIIPLNHRKKVEATWKKALAFINENESRIRTEVQTVKGEPYEVWRWVGGLNVSTKSNKSWQGQAFETQSGSPNCPPCSPTSCLKIRGMVEEGDRNLHTIREAVLVKCGERARILHCTVDLNSKCVYLKCVDPKDAAIAYQSLHGWWYSSHLVTVKYLRDERYMQRFPDSPTYGPPFLKAHISN